MRVEPQAQFINDDHQPGGVVDGRGRGVGRRSRSVLTWSKAAVRLEWPKGAIWKLLVHGLFSHSWAPPKEAAEGADGRAECGKRGTS